MKVQFFYTLIFVLILGACQDKEETTIITGQLAEDYKNITITLMPIEAYFPGLDNKEEKFLSTTTDSTGFFTFKSHQIASGFYQIVNKYHFLNHDLYLEKGDSIYIEEKSSAPTPSLKISGKGSEKLDFSTEDYKIFPKDRSFYDSIESNAFETELAFKNYIDSIFDERIQKLNSNETVPKELKSYFSKYINGERALFLLKHLERRNYHMHGTFDYFYPEEAYYSFIEDLDFDDEFCKSSAAKELAQTYLEYKARLLFKGTETDKWWDEQLSLKFEYILNLPQSEWKDILALSTIRSYSLSLLSDGFFQNLLAFEEKMDSSFYNEKNRIHFKANISSFKALAPGQPAPAFELPDSSGLLKKTIDFKGKIVYIDFWGTWCMPCIQAIPAGLELQEKYKGKPVEFIYVALESKENIKKWKSFISGQSERFNKAINNKPFSGVHLVAEEQFRNEQIQSYKINFAPTYVLLDSDGNIVDARAKSPSKIAEIIDGLLDEM